jgi:hypothetical protein
MALDGQMMGAGVHGRAFPLFSNPDNDAKLRAGLPCPSTKVLSAIFV